MHSTRAGKLKHRVAQEARSQILLHILSSTLKEQHIAWCAATDCEQQEHPDTLRRNNELNADEMERLPKWAHLRLRRAARRDASSGEQERRGGCRCVGRCDAPSPSSPAHGTNSARSDADAAEAGEAADSRSHFMRSIRSNRLENRRLALERRETRRGWKWFGRRASASREKTERSRN